MLEDVPAQICEAKLWRVTDSCTLLNNFALVGKIALLNLLPQAKENRRFYLTGHLTG